MLPALILVASFLLGFLLGYATRERRSRKRRTHYMMYGRYMSRSQSGSSFPGSWRASSDSRPLRQRSEDLERGMSREAWELSQSRS
jgi:hypothetical protein